MPQRLRDALKSYFVNGARPDAADFADLLDSFVNSTDDQVFIDTAQNVGLGVADPDTKLHVNGGVRVGNVTGSDPASIAQGTLRWTGARLEIFYGAEWYAVWPVEPAELPAAAANPVRSAPSNPALPRADLESRFVNDALLNAGDFNGLIDSFISKEDEGISISSGDRVGIGASSPLARLHVQGGLLMGDVPEAGDTRTEEEKVGTLRWTGSSLDIYYNAAWHVVWPRNFASVIFYHRDNVYDEYGERDGSGNYLGIPVSNSGHTTPGNTTSSVRIPLGTLTEVFPVASIFERADGVDFEIGEITIFEMHFEVSGTFLPDQAGYYPGDWLEVWVRAEDDSILTYGRFNAFRIQGGVFRLEFPSPVLYTRNPIRAAQRFYLQVKKGRRGSSDRGTGNLYIRNFWFAYEISA